MNQDWQRLQRVIEWAGESINSFAGCIGLKRAQNLYNIRDGKHKLSRDLTELIITKFEMINKQWLLTGEGEMLISDNTQNKCEIAFYAKDATTFDAWDRLLEADNYFSMPFYVGCDFAALSMSDAMEPEVPRGCILLFESCDINKIVYGKTYYVVTDNIRLVRNLRHSIDEQSVDLVASNVKSYDAMTVKKSNIKHLYLVRAIIINKTI